jgi:DNA-binding Lrp family transcriptional regulator
MAGDCDLLLRVLPKDLDDYRRFRIEHLGRIGGVRDIKTDIPMQKGKQSAELPVR